MATPAENRGSRMGTWAKNYFLNADSGFADHRLQWAGFTLWQYANYTMLTLGILSTISTLQAHGDPSLSIIVDSLGVGSELTRLLHKNVTLSDWSYVPPTEEEFAARAAARRAASSGGTTTKNLWTTFVPSLRSKRENE